jgi:hypothetical protein
MSRIGYFAALYRRAAWFLTQHMASEPSTLHDIAIDGLDWAVSVGGRTILYPPFKSEAIATILAAEVKDVRGVIDILVREQPKSALTSAGN